MASSRPVAETGDLATRIEEVATRLFLRHGYNGVSYLDIARELGTTHSNVHYYFRTKAKLAETVLRAVSTSTIKATSGIWTDPATSLREKFIRTRDWIYSRYLMFTTNRVGCHKVNLWTIKSRFALLLKKLNLICNYRTF